jgi:MFS family permease
MLSFDALQVRMFNFFRLPGITGSSDVQKEGFSLTKSNTKPLHGKLSDIFGRRNVLLASVAIFLLGSVLCAVSKNMIMLIIMRALQGELRNATPERYNTGTGACSSANYL